MNTLLTQEEKSHFSHHFGFRLRYLIHKCGLYEYEFIKRSGINRRQLYRMLDGNNPTLHNICLAAKTLGVHPMEMLNSNFKKEVRRPPYGIINPDNKNKEFIEYKDYDNVELKKEDFAFPCSKTKSPKRK